MTSEQPPATPTVEQTAAPRRLRRRENDRVIAGVAGGLADYLNVDPLLLRAGFAGLMIFGGAGLVLYIAAWLLIPVERTDESIADEALRGLGVGVGRPGIAIVVVFGGVALGAWLSGYGPGQRYREAAVLALAIVALGILVVRWGEQRLGARSGVSTSPAPASSPAAVLAREPAAGQPAAVDVPQWRPRVRLKPRRRDRSTLPWWIVAASLGGTALLAVIGSLPGLRVTPGQYFGAVLALLGLGLVVGSWWGRARSLITLGIVLVPVAVGAAFVTVPLEGGFGDLALQPQTVGDLRPEYRLAAGGMWLDLSDLPPGDQPVSIVASVGVGRLVVVLPADARLQLESRVNGGRLVLFGNRQIGTSLIDRLDRPTGAGPTLVLHLAVGLGDVSIQTAPGS